MPERMPHLPRAERRRDELEALDARIAAIKAEGPTAEHKRELIALMFSKPVMEDLHRADAVAEMLAQVDKNPITGRPDVPPLSAGIPA